MRNVSNAVLGKPPLTLIYRPSLLLFPSLSIPVTPLNLRSSALPTICPILFFILYFSLSLPIPLLLSFFPAPLPSSPPRPPFFCPFISPSYLCSLPQSSNVLALIFHLPLPPTLPAPSTAHYGLLQ